jgi:hypothetical protein
MGYTHYWYGQRPFTPAEWQKITSDVTAVLQTSAVPLCWEFDEPDRRPQIDADAIRFNGIGKHGHETFLLDRQPDDFTFCKTAQKPYDRLVCAALIIAAKHAPHALRITSDGDYDKWEPGLNLVRQTLGASYAIPIEKETT